MNIRSLKASLRQHPDRNIRFVLPGGDFIPAAVHVTEVGHLTRNFVDCGGTVRSVESCLLQAWVADDDRAHRLAAGKLARILELSSKVVPSEDLAVEVEYDCCVVAQYALSTATVEGDELLLALANKTTDCLARESCGTAPAEPGCGCGGTAARCC